ncbi:hypothetical protein D3C86_1934330 [compost metagenome]
MPNQNGGFAIQEPPGPLEILGNLLQDEGQNRPEQQSIQQLGELHVLLIDGIPHKLTQHKG